MFPTKYELKEFYIIFRNSFFWNVSSEINVRKCCYLTYHYYLHRYSKSYSRNLFNSRRNIWSNCLHCVRLHLPVCLLTKCRRVLLYVENIFYANATHFLGCVCADFSISKECVLRLSTKNIIGLFWPIRVSSIWKEEKVTYDSISDFSSSCPYPSNSWWFEEGIWPS